MSSWTYPICTDEQIWQSNDCMALYNVIILGSWFLTHCILTTDNHVFYGLLCQDSLSPRGHIHRQKVKIINTVFTLRIRYGIFKHWFFRVGYITHPQSLENIKGTHLYLESFERNSCLPTQNFSFASCMATSMDKTPKDDP